MQLPRSSRSAARLEWLDSAGSTNDELLRRAVGPEASAWPHLSVVATGTQTGGRGRLGRSWVTPPGTALAVSVLLRPAMPVGAYGWLSLAAGAAMTEAVRAAGADASLKWPNDVLIGDAKVSGILSELLPDLRGAVVGAGVNLTMRRDQLPVETATSLVLAGADPDLDRLLASYLEGLASRVDRLAQRDGDAEASGLRAEVHAACGTIGRSVRVLLPDGSERVGEATGIDADGRLEVRPSDGAAFAVAAGEVTHLRY